MSTVLLHPLPPTLPAGYCIGSGVPGLQAFVNLVIGGTVVPLDVSTSTFFNFGSSVPSAENRIYPWYRWSASQPELNGWYVFESGYWLRPNPVEAACGIRQIWRGLLADIDTFDGGEVAAVTDIRGPMWEIDHDMDYRVPVGAGTLPDATVLTMDADGGANKHVLTVAEMPAHLHTITAEPNCDIDQVSNRTLAGRDGNPGEFAGSMDTGTTGTDQGHNNMQPYRVVSFIKRTARVFHRLGP